MAELIVMDRTGDSRTAFTPDDAASVATAMEKFAEMTGKGYFATVPGDGGEPGRLIRAFDPAAEKIIMSPQLIGG